MGNPKAHHQRSGAEEVPEVPTGAQCEPPHYEFLWASRGCVEANKMKVLEVLAKTHDRSQLPSQTSMSRL